VVKQVELDSFGMEDLDKFFDEDNGKQIIIDFILKWDINSLNIAFTYRGVTEWWPEQCLRA
jgi:hypothetical protein